MRVPITVPVRHRTIASINNIIQIQDGTFYRRHPSLAQSAPDESNSALFPNLDFSLPALPLRRKSSNWSDQEHWAVVGASGVTKFLEILRGAHICIPPNARTFPYLSSEAIEAKDYRLRSPSRAIQYVGFTSGKNEGMGGGIKGSYLSARYESRREETDWSVLQYLRGETELNPSQDLQEKDGSFNALLWQVIKDLKLERLLSMPVSNLSNGQTRRARIAKALLDRPEVLLLDEPFMGLDPPTLLSLSPILRELAYKSSPRLILSLRPQDPIPDWITHLAILGLDYTLALAGPKEDVLFAVHRWSNAYGRPKCGTAAKMAALMTKRYGEPLTDFGHTLSSTGVSDYKTFSRVMSSPKPSYVQPNGEMAPEYLHPIDQQIWRQAAKVLRHEVDLDGLLALTCLLPKDFKCPVDGSPSSHEVSMVHSSRAPIETATQANPSPQSLTLNAFIELQNVIVSYGSKTVLGHGIQHGFTAPGLNLTIREGTRLALLGPNGSGKTTLLSLLTSDHPQSYSLPIKFFGRSRLPSQGQPGLSLWEIQSRIGHSSPEIHSFFPKGLTISRTLESAWAETFGAKPKLTEGSMKLVDVFLRWWEPELNPFHHPPPTPTQSTSTSAIDDWLSTSYPPAKPSLPNPDDLSWASSPTTTFSTLPFQSQRLLLLLRALIKNPDLVILDEAFSGFSPETRDKAMLFLRAGEGFMLQRRRVSTVENGKNNERDSGIEKRSPWSKALNHRHRIEQICQISGIAPEHLLRDRGTLPENIREIIDNLKGMTAMQLDQMTSNLLGADEDGNGKGYMFTGLKPKQALIVVSHVREEIPVVVNEYVRLPGEEEVSEMGRGVECGRFEDGLEGWNRIWGLGQRDV